MMSEFAHLIFINVTHGEYQLRVAAVVISSVPNLRIASWAMN
jgi:hypothetical protein